jgi:hypothetical protein
MEQSRPADGRRGRGAHRRSARGRRWRARGRWLCTRGWWGGTRRRRGGLLALTARSRPPATGQRGEHGDEAHHRERAVSAASQHGHPLIRVAREQIPPRRQWAVGTGHPLRLCGTRHRRPAVCRSSALIRGCLSTEPCRWNGRTRAGFSCTSLGAFGIANLRAVDHDPRPLAKKRPPEGGLLTLLHHAVYVVNTQIPTTVRLIPGQDIGVSLSPREAPGPPRSPGASLAL